MKIFDKSFTQQESIPSHGIEKAVDILKSGRLHRYNTGPGEISETALLESEYANYQGAEYLSLIHISEPTRLRCISYAVFCLKKK